MVSLLRYSVARICFIQGKRPGPEKQRFQNQDGGRCCKKHSFQDTRNRKRRGTCRQGIRPWRRNEPVGRNQDGSKGLYLQRDTGGYYQGVQIGRRCVERYGFVPFGRTLIDQIAGPTLRAFLLFFFRSMRSLFLSFQMVCVRTKWQDFLKKICQQSI